MLRIPAKRSFGAIHFKLACRCLMLCISNKLGTSFIKISVASCNKVFTRISPSSFTARNEILFIAKAWELA